MRAEEKKKKTRTLSLTPPLRPTSEQHLLSTPPYLHDLLITPLNEVVPRRISDMRLLQGCCVPKKEQSIPPPPFPYLRSSFKSGGGGGRF